MESEELQRVIDRGVRTAQDTLHTGYFSTGGVPRTKTHKVRQMDRARLEEIVAVLDLLRWYGSWGTTRHGIEMELIRRAKEIDVKRTALEGGTRL